MAFRSRIYNGLGDFLYDFLRFIINSFAYIRNASNRRVEQALREKLMVAVSGVLECKYCTWLHSEMALTHGVDEAEIQKLLSSELGDFPEDESVALAFAQHYSESGGKPNEGAKARFFNYYGAKKAKDILSYIQIIYFGNLSGNTVDAFLSRLKGQVVEDSNLFTEVVIFMIVGPYYLGILSVLAHVLGYYNAKRKRRARGAV